MNIPPEQYDNNSLYDKEFFKNQTNWSINSAKIILPIVLGVLPKVNSAVDFGCGTGTWLSELKNLGVNEIQGFDGSWAEKSLVIPSECFTTIEFDKEFIKTKKYDLAISLEVAEHLNEQSSRKFIEMLTNASDIILFSAAIPFQGGTNHINEQWQSYWYNIFNEYGYTGTSYLRKKFIKNKKISFFYKQNIILYVKREMLKLVNILRISCIGKYITVFH